MKLKPIELALIFALVITVLFSTSLSAEADGLSSKLIRLHVVADSDSDEEQSLKLKVRDAVLSYLESELAEAESRDDAEALINGRIDVLQKIAEGVIASEGKTHGVTVSLTEEFFQETDYDTFSLPSGRYLSLRIVIGSGKGHNWWCVVFPKVCYAGILNDESSAEIGLTEGELSLITRDSRETVIRFRAIDLLARLKKLLGF